MKRFTKIILCWIVLQAGLTDSLNAQNDTLKPCRKTVLTIGTTALWTAGTLGLYSLWYKDYPASSFHTFNDNAEWLQMDKAGHLVTANITASLGYEAFQWAGYSNEKSLWMGGGMGWIFLTTLEVMDGFNTQWGFSWGDVACNTVGGLAFIMQQKHWNEQRIQFKASYHATSLAGYRPDLLGDQWYEQIIKDYNGQTYWLCINPASFSHKRLLLPSWVNVAAGYSAYGMLGGRINPAIHDNVVLPSQERYRRFFISPDISLSRLPVRNKTLRSICKTLDFIKLPLPAIEFHQKKGLLFHLLYF